MGYLLSFSFTLEDQLEELALYFSISRPPVRCRNDFQRIRVNMYEPFNRESRRSDEGSRRRKWCAGKFRTLISTNPDSTPIWRGCISALPNMKFQNRNTAKWKFCAILRVLEINKWFAVFLPHSSPASLPLHTIDLSSSFYSTVLMFPHSNKRQSRKRTPFPFFFCLSIPVILSRFYFP